MGCAGAGWWLWQQHITETETYSADSAETLPLTVQTVVVHQQSVPADRRLTGTVEAIDVTTLTSRVTGRVEQLLVQEGTQVEKGQVIAIIDVSDIQAKQQQAEAQIIEAEAAVLTAQANRRSALTQVYTAQEKLSEAKASLLEAQAELADAQLNQRRMSRLYPEGAVPEVDLDTANTRVDVLQARIRQIEATIAQSASTIKSAEAAVEEATASVGQAQARVAQAEATAREVTANLDYGVVRAPFAGVITKKQVEIGAIAGVNQPLVTLESRDRLRLSVAVPESLIDRVQLGQSVTVHIDALNRQIAGQVSQIVPSADPQARNFTVKVALPPTTNLISGMFGRLQLENTERTALVIPSNTLVERLGVSGVFKVVDGKAQFQTVTVHPINDDAVEVFAGVNEGDRLILNPDPGLRENTEVSESNYQQYTKGAPYVE
ncbi:MAG: efflux RND transporter periplasmic adaptor subunit [Cyanobacteria bacterium CRU_2_1]|nr:efflux RND transporter periplasmic adaptor subunit [Cyanobacteria bacterium RU_5_0]NJR59573.1 efflux RND transporter periplasmic adaptor subunit [Cyanobacteria bacterium CRU_2_1]